MIMALLNDDGKKVWGYVFPDGEIPVKSIAPFNAKLGDIGNEKVFLVDWAALTENQRSLILHHLSEKFDVSIFNIEEKILTTGLPIRGKYVSSTSFPAHLI